MFQCESLVLFTQKKFFWLDEAQKNWVGVSCSTVIIGSLFIRFTSLFFALLDLGMTIIWGFMRLRSSIRLVFWLRSTFESLLLCPLQRCTYILETGDQHHDVLEKQPDSFSWVCGVLLVNWENNSMDWGSVPQPHKELTRVYGSEVGSGSVVCTEVIP